MLVKIRGRGSSGRARPPLLKKYEGFWESQKKTSTVDMYYNDSNNVRITSDEEPDLVNKP